jgi:cytidine deaminase
MNEDIQYLIEGLECAVAKKNDTHAPGHRSVSLCYSESGKKYRGANVDSDTNLLTISPEQSALLSAVAHHDYRIKEIVTLVEQQEDAIVNPTTIKILIDFSVRTGITISYRIIDINGDVLFNIQNVRNTIPSYIPPTMILSKTREETLTIAKEILDANTSLPEQLKKYAQRGLLSSFTTSDTASGYGAAVTTEDGSIYFTGQYSSPEKRSGVHAEMAAITLALMDNNQKIVSLGLVSTKYEEDPCEICGCCRQFLAEINAKYNLNISLYCFAKNTDDFKQYTIDELLPHQWSSKKWH